MAVARRCWRRGAATASSSSGSSSAAASAALAPAAASVALLLALAAARAQGARPLDRSREGAFVGWREDAAAVPVRFAVPCQDGALECAAWARDGRCATDALTARTCGVACKACSPSAGALESQQPHAPAPWPPRVLQVRVAGLGTVAIRLLDASAPRTVEFVAGVAASGACSGGAGRGRCQFYRSEALPEPGAIDNFGGPGE